MTLTANLTINCGIRQEFISTEDELQNPGNQCKGLQGALTVEPHSGLEGTRIVSMSLKANGNGVMRNFEG